ncbi:MAG: amidohydrolase family protein [Clostridia bacterium]|nr:amidohydrolase family protein [Clostridia bacterium]
MKYPKIDMHMHCCDRDLMPPFVRGRMSTPEDVRAVYDLIGIERGLWFPMGASPECAVGTLSVREIRETARKYKDTIGWWCAPVDPRNIRNDPDSDFDTLLGWYRELGAVGISEMSANLPLDDPRFISLFKACARHHMPVTLHFGISGRGYGVVDDLHLPRLERVLEQVPGLILIGHSPIWWNEISTDVTNENREGYVTGPLRGEGRIQALLRRFPDLYCDLSANSAYAALMRDPNYSCRFLEEFSRQVLYGTDIAFPHAAQAAPFIRGMSDFLDTAAADGRLSRTAYERICRENAMKLIEA